MNHLKQLLEYTKVADSHANRLEFAINKLELPIKVKRFSDNEEITYVDMVVYRFGRLQDIIGSKIFPRILNELGENDKSFIDKLNKLEKLEVIKSASWWMDMRELRNELTHDYPETEKEFVKNINLLAKSTKKLLLNWKEIKKFIEKLKSRRNGL